MTGAGDGVALDFLQFFDGHRALPEFNDPTYAGVSIYALTVAATYLGSTNSTIG